MKKIKDYSSRYEKLKNDILSLKEYAFFLKEKNSRISGFLNDIVLTEMNDLLLGIKNGKIVMPYKRLLLGSEYCMIDGISNDKKLEELIYSVQNDIYSIKRYIDISEKTPHVFHKKHNENINRFFPNLKCNGNIKINCISFADEDMMTITFPGGYVIDLGYLPSEKVYLITVTKNNDWQNIIEEIQVNFRYEIEECLQNLIEKYENL